MNGIETIVLLFINTTAIKTMVIWLLFTCSSLSMLYKLHKCHHMANKKSPLLTRRRKLIHFVVTIDCLIGLYMQQVMLMEYDANGCNVNQEILLFIFLSHVLVILILIEMCRFNDLLPNIAKKFVHTICHKYGEGYNTQPMITSHIALIIG